MVKPTGTGLYWMISAIFFTTMLLPSFISDVEATTGSHSHRLDFYFPAVSKSTAAGSYSGCNGGSIEECLMNGEEEEVEMDSETNRRILLGRRRYISYGALMRNRVPCKIRGVSYYNCRPGRPVNPYNRGCSAITRCRHF